ncbi:MAG: 16S rRNA (adenine(1518)-N(6)/adenine(1519)-N(6))-dimethyltransferase RsmA [Myxococcaceae bacterium]|nr:16S rRNA (adenine(1518)-N(6)/adenine(1519)-N(6))-dimethyltransferase RsmA [Myxococcaceae bacterium]
MHARDLLKQLGLRAKESWGQNFLSDEGVLADIAEACGLRAGDTVVELGPGLGSLTRALLATGAKVVAVERDRDMVAALEAMKLEGLTVVAGNAAETDFAKVAGVPDVVVCGNLPYHLSSPILFEVLEQAHAVKRAVFTLQAEVVERLAARPGGRDYGLLTVLLGLRYDIENVMSLPAAYFHPPPKVDSAVVALERLSKPRAEVTSDAHFKKVVKASFAHRRKTLSNSLKGDKALEPLVAEALAKSGIDGKRRAETLSVEEFAALERAFGPSGGASSAPRPAPSSSPPQG